MSWYLLVTKSTVHTYNISAIIDTRFNCILAQTLDISETTSVRSDKNKSALQKDYHQRVELIKHPVG